MGRGLTYNRKKVLVYTILLLICLVFLFFRLIYIVTARGKEYSSLAQEVQERERKVKASRGLILDRNGVVLASNIPVCVVSVIHNQIEDEVTVASTLSQMLQLDYDSVLKKVKKVTSIEIISRNVDSKVGTELIRMNVPGIKVDTEYKRYYPYGSLASKVLGFAGGDNQGILGIEAKYDEYLTGQDGIIYSVTDARGVEVHNQRKSIKDPVPGKDLTLTIDYQIQQVCNDSAIKALEECKADSVSIIAMNPQNGELYAMVDAPEYDLNHPFDVDSSVEAENKSEELNRIWRNACLNDTYEPGSIFKTVTASIALEEKLVSLEEAFYCHGSINVEGQTIHCHKTTGHGSETFVTALMNSCNPVFIQLGLRIGSDKFYNYFDKFGLLQPTGIDLAGEANTLMHKRSAIHSVELATIAFGQSFQVSPIQMATTVSSLINGGERVTPHLALSVTNEYGEPIIFEYNKRNRIISEETSETLRMLLEKVVSEGSGKNGAVEGYEIGGKTATSQTLPRSAHKYIASFVGFYPASDPRILVMVIIRNPTGVYYGGTIAAPVASEIYEKVLPYLDKTEQINYTNK